MKSYFSILRIIFIYSNFLIVVNAQTIQKKEHTTSTIEPSVSRATLIEFAKTYLGTPYCYGSSNPTKGFDCSGFVNFVFNNFNIIVPRSSKEFKDFGKSINPEQYQIGDILVFYGYKDNTVIGHLGIICEANGMNSKFIHSSSGKVKEVIISELNSRLYTQRFYKCITVIP
jgi:cell wall-associated NlpC family hydrolase